MTFVLLTGHCETGKVREQQSYLLTNLSHKWVFAWFLGTNMCSKTHGRTNKASMFDYKKMGVNKFITFYLQIEKIDHIFLVLKSITH